MPSNSNNSTVTKELFLSARKAWPERGGTDLLSAPIRRVYESWAAVPEAARLTALGAAVSEGFPRLPGRDSKNAQCRDLTLAGSPLPDSHADVVPLTADQVGSVGAPPAEDAVASKRGRRSHARAVQDSASWVQSEPAPHRGRTARRQAPLVSPAGQGGPTSADGVERRSHSEPPQSDRRRGGSPAASIHTDLSRGTSPEDRRVAALERKLAQQDERIRQLFAQQLAEPHEDVSSAYLVLDEVWHQVGKDAAAERCSWLNINALKKREAGEIIRMHSGTFPHYPCELDIIGTLKKLPGVKDAQIPVRILTSI